MSGDDERSASDDAPADDAESVADIIEEAEPAVRVDNSGEEYAVSVVADAEADTADEDEAVAGSFAPDVAVTPQAPARENVVFVALGVYLTILALAQTVPGIGVAPATIGLVTVVVAVGTAVCYGALLWTTPDT